MCKDPKRTPARLFRTDTPVEVYHLAGRRIRVKREDLYGCPPAPPLAKLRGLRSLLANAYIGGVRVVGCWDTRISMLGLGLAACCREFSGLRCIVSYPMGKGDNTPPQALLARELGAKLLPVRAGRINICFAAARRHVQRQGGFMLPFGLECEEAVAAVATEAGRLDVAQYARGTIVVACGSGVTLAGLLRGLTARPHCIIGVSSGRSCENILRCVRRHVPNPPDFLELHAAEIPYRTELNYPCPFPSNPYYDLKAWKFLAEHLPEFKDPVLFWNIGA